MRTRTTLALAAACLMSVASAPMIAQAQPPLTMQSERAAHPNLAHAIRAMQAALAEMQAAPDDFGGNKGQAMADTRAAIHSLKRALYYRLRMDDAAIDRIR